VTSKAKKPLDPPRVFRVYLVTNEKNGKRYVGITSRSVRARWMDHKSRGRASRRYNRPLYNAIAKYGSQAFSVRTIAATISWQRACKSEEECIHEYGTLAPQGYNLTLGGEGNLGRVVTASQREAIRQAATGRKVSVETRKLLSAMRKGKPKSSQHAAKLAALCRVRNVSAEHRARLSSMRKGKPMSVRSRAALLRANKGRKLTRDHRAKISLAGKGLKHRRRQRRPRDVRGQGRLFA
jgi:group I intron endonuclease